ncbi:MAG: hypothetical protein CMH82_00050 [Nocardioides sp.]|nr:hypothetical protein [Nocardioides sp.]|tara:strand:+ start:1620 stop:1943 length:324 start_codon:yes stop_codon:yes gene_type:complete
MAILKRMKRWLFSADALRHAVLLAVMTLVIVEPAYAQDLSGLQKMLDNIVKALTGGIGRSIAILGVVGLGLMMIIGRLNWIVFIMILAGIAIVFSAAAIVDGMGAGG